MLGNEAVARGLYESGCRVASAYPGTPSTEIMEYLSKYPDVYAEWAPNEKVAYEAALGASIAGARAFCAMKHVGLNVAADPLFTSSYTGVGGGLIVAVADDQGLHSSQNEQDSRNYAVAAKLPMLEPSDSAEASAFVREAYALSEQFDTPVLLRLSTRVSHSQSLVEEADRTEIPLKDYEKNPAKYVMMPGNARVRHHVVEERMKQLSALAETTALNPVEWNSKRIGIISAGIAYQYAREALGTTASYLKLGMVHPLPEQKIKDFAAQVDVLYVIEELDGVIESYCRQLGVACKGKEIFGYEGEYSQRRIREALLGEAEPVTEFDGPVPVRPPAMCPGCPHRGLFYVLKKLKLTVSGDIGCYTLGSTPPLSAMDTTICMGASVSALHGFNKARGWEDKSVAVIGDSTFMHSGITGLINIVYNQGFSTVLVLDNSITGMTGHQDNPSTGRTLSGAPVPKISIDDLCRAAGVSRVRVVDPNDLKELETALREELRAQEPSVIIARRPCILLPGVKRGKPFHVDADKCKACKGCMHIGCPAIQMTNIGAVIDNTLCVGCGLCVKLCAFGAILSSGEASK
jgi:indolepyruvate ferredoxin oxidoreductase alpha subunit